MTWLILLKTPATEDRKEGGQEGRREGGKEGGMEGRKYFRRLGTNFFFLATVRVV